MPNHRSAVHMRGYFKAPRTGDYNFWVAGDDTVDVYINRTPSTSDFSTAEKILHKCNHTYNRAYFYPSECDFRS